jgi:hypothetical protein
MLRSQAAALRLRNRHALADRQQHLMGGEIVRLSEIDIIAGRQGQVQRFGQLNKVILNSMLAG